MGEEAPLPENLINLAIANIWDFIKSAQEKFVPDNGLHEEGYGGEDYANVMVVGPALIVLTKGTIEEKVQGIVEVVSKGGTNVDFQ